MELKSRKRQPATDVSKTVAKATADAETLRSGLKRLAAGELIAGTACTLDELSRRLGRATGYFSHVFSGKIALRADHVTGVLAAMEVEPADFFALVYGLKKNSGSPGEPDPTEEKLVRAMRRVFFGDDHGPHESRASFSVD